MVESLYEVDSESIMRASKDARLKADFWQAMQAAGAGQDGREEFDFEDALRTWQGGFAEHAPHLLFLFNGDRRSAEEGNGDPAVAVHSHASVCKLVELFGAFEEQTFEEVSGEAWPLAPLQEFLVGVAERGSGLALVWEE